MESEEKNDAARVGHGGRGKSVENRQHLFLTTINTPQRIRETEETVRLENYFSQKQFARETVATNIISGKKLTATQTTYALCILFTIALRQQYGQNP